MSPAIILQRFYIELYSFNEFLLHRLVFFCIFCFFLAFYKDRFSLDLFCSTHMNLFRNALDILLDFRLQVSDISDLHPLKVFPLQLVFVFRLFLGDHWLNESVWKDQFGFKLIISVLIVYYPLNFRVDTHENIIHSA